MSRRPIKKLAHATLVRRYTRLIQVCDRKENSIALAISEKQRVEGELAALQETSRKIYYDAGELQRYLKEAHESLVGTAMAAGNNQAAALEVIKEKTRTTCRLRGALTDLFRMWYRREKGDASWSPADVLRLQEIVAIEEASYTDEIEIEEDKANGTLQSDHANQRETPAGSTGTNATTIPHR